MTVFFVSPCTTNCAVIYDIEFMYVTLIGSGDYRIKKVGGHCGQGKSRGGQHKCHLAWWFFLFLKITSL